MFIVKKKIVEKHPLAIRWFHWLNFPIMIVMVGSGLLIYWANDIYRIGFGDMTLVKFFPDNFYKTLDIPFHLADGMAFHFFFMWFFFINGLLYVLYLLFSGEWRTIFPNKRSFGDGLQVFLHDIGLQKKVPEYNVYNGAQKIIYTATIFMGLIMLLSGLAIYKPIQLSWLTKIFGGYEGARLTHFVVTLLFVLFFVVHIVQVIRAGWNNFRGMVAGFRVEKEPEIKEEEA